MARQHLPLALSVALALPVPLSAGQKVWSQPVDGQSIIPSVQFASPWTEDVEAADDFALVGSVERILVAGYNVSGCGDDVAGVRVRFYANAGGVPGAVQHDVVVPAGSPLLAHAACPAGLDVTLPSPFQASGDHFVSVQLLGVSVSAWTWWTANTNHPVGAPLHWRDHLAGGAWSTTVAGQPKNADLAFELYGTGPPPPPPTEELWAQFKTFLGDQLPAGVWPGPTPGDLETADDFDLVGAIEHVQIAGEICFGCASPTGVTGAWVRFYDAAGDAPGALLQEEFVPWGSAQFACSCWQSVDLFLATPFQASGHHFVSVQIAASQPHDFGWSESNEGQPVLASLKVRDRLAGDPWTSPSIAPSSDLSFRLIGKDLTPPPTLGADPCGDWGAVPVPQGVGTAEVLTGVAVIADDDVWVVGRHDGGPRALHWDGSAWTETSVPWTSASPGHVASLEDVEAVGPDDVWAAGSQWQLDAQGFPKPHAFVVHWDGTAWTEVKSTLEHTRHGVNGIEVLSADDVWFVGSAHQTFGPGCNQALTMHWDGSNLTPIETECPDLGCEVGALGGYALEQASAIASDDIWAVGGGTGPYFGICTYVVHYDGTAWSHVPTPEPGIVRRLFDVHALAPDDVWALGQYLDGLGYHPYAIHFDGVGWTLMDLPDGAGGSLHAFGTNDVYAVGGGVFRYDGAGWTWVDDLGTVSGEVLYAGLGDVDGVSPCGLWAVGSRTDFGLGKLPFAVRQAAGPSWSAQLREPCGQAAPSGGIALVQPPQLGQTFAVALDDPAGVAGLTPGATQTVWALATSPAPGFPCGVSVPGFGELLIAVTPTPILPTAPIAWSGPGMPATHAVLLPADPALAGVGLSTQGLLLDAGGTSRLTAGLDVVLGF
jgi:hypothetical protein